MANSHWLSGNLDFILIMMISQRVENIVMISYFHLKIIPLAAMRRISFRGLG